MTLTRSILIVLLLTAFTAEAQEVIQRSYPVTRSVTRFDTTIFIVDGYPAPNDILSLFKPNEVELNRIDNPTVGKGVLVMGIHVLDTGHLVLKYLKHKASMDVGDQNFPHGKIPGNIRIGSISGMGYVETEGHTADILILTISSNAEGAKQKIQFRSQPKTIAWYE